MIIVLLNATDSCKSNRHLVTTGYYVFLRLRTRGKRDPKGKRMKPYIELKPVMTIKAEALVAPLECSVPTIQDIQRIKSFFFHLPQTKPTYFEIFKNENHF